MRRPVQVTVISLFQFGKAAILLLIPALALLYPRAIRDTPFLGQLIFVATRGRNLPGMLMPLIGLYVGWIGYGLWHLKDGARRNVLLGSLVTIVVSLIRLGVFDVLLGTGLLHSIAGQQTVMIVTLFDSVIFIYLAFHPDITASFSPKR